MGYSKVGKRIIEKTYEVRVTDTNDTIFANEDAPRDVTDLAVANKEIVSNNN